MKKTTVNKVIDIKYDTIDTIINININTIDNSSLQMIRRQ